MSEVMNDKNFLDDNKFFQMMETSGDFEVVPCDR